ncbi:MAG TPA: alpha-E domain-containing protein [Actinomycetota bacterium]|nr:alpha-E domain-containing protein [Actinomycetota bacterium]
MLSRVADAIYWMNRYLERADNIARFIDVNYHLTLDVRTGDEQWLPLIATTAALPQFHARYDKPTRANVIKFMAFDRENPNSILSCVERARENARSVRDQITIETWEEINGFYRMVRHEASLGSIGSDPYRFLASVKRTGSLIQGVVDATTSRSEGWHWGRIARMLERADKTSRILDVKYFILLPNVTDVGTPLDDLQWTALLKSASALEMYRKRYGRIAPERVAGFLLLDREFPRSVQFCVHLADLSLRRITGTQSETFSNKAEQMLGRLGSMLAYSGIGEIVAAGLHEFLDQLQRDLNTVDDAIYEGFFALRPAGVARGGNQ